LNVAILGASSKADRLSNLAQQRLVAAGHRVFPITPMYAEILGVKTYPDLTSIDEPIHTLTIYLAPDKLSPLMPQILNMKPQRVIFNPGSEDDGCIAQLASAGIAVQTACTLVMLSAASF